MSAKLTTTKTPKAATTEFFEVLATVTPQEAIDHLVKPNSTHHLLPAHTADALERDLSRITAACERLHYNAATMTTQMATLVETTSGVRAVTKFHNDLDSELLHRDRNLALVLAVAAAASFDGNWSLVLERATRITSPRTLKTRRPLADDEILLLRLVTHLMADSHRDSLTAAVYVLVEAGCTPAEACLLPPAAVDDLEAPREVLADHNDQLAPRLLALDDFERPMLSRVVAAHHRQVPTDGYLFYNPRGDINAREKPKNGATALAHDRMTRLMNRTGLNHKDTAATSIRAWRIATTYTHLGEAAALEQAGLPTGATERLSKLIPTAAAATKTVLADAGVSFVED